MTIYLRQSTAGQEIPLGHFLDSTDGDTEETGLTIANTDIKIWKFGATSLANKNSGGATHMSNGIYYIVLDDTDTNTLGSMVVFVHVAGALVAKETCLVLPPNVYDSLIPGSDLLDVNASQLGGTGQTGRDIGASVLLSSGTGAGQVSLSSGQVTVATNNDKAGYSLTQAFPANFASLAINGSGYVTYSNTAPLDAAGIRTAVGLAAANLDTQLGDIPTVSEFNARSLAAADYATAANQNIIAGYIDTEIGTIITHLTDIKGGTFNEVTDSLEAIRDRGDAAWRTATGFSTFNPASDQVTVSTNNDKTGYSLSGTLTTLDALDTAQDTQHATTRTKMQRYVSLLVRSDDAVFTDLLSELGELNANYGSGGGDYSNLFDSQEAVRDQLTTVGTDVDSILEDTSELQTDWADGGRLDLLLDAAGSGGGDATAENQTTIISHLTGIKGGGWSASTDTLEKIRDSLRTASITITGPVTSTGRVSVIKGDDYSADDGRSLDWTSASWPTLTSGSATIYLYTPGETSASYTYSLTIIDAATVRLELTANQTSSMSARNYIYEIIAVLSNGHTVTLVQGSEFNVTD